MKTLIRILILLQTVTLVPSCASPHKEGLSEYEDLIDKNSAGEKVFHGVYENFDFRATALSKTVIASIIDRKAELYQWDESTKKIKHDEMLTKLGGKTSLFISFFTPNRNENNLDSKKSIWMIYLDTKGTRYTGKATRNNTHATELIAAFPYHTRWANAYDVVFDLPLENFEIAGSKVTVTGPLGKREVIFE